MTQLLQLFFVNLYFKLFEWFLNFEIYHMIFPHFNGRRRGYRFDSRDALFRLNIIDNLDARLMLETIERQADIMGESYSRAFRYIMYRDINRRMRLYAKLVQRRIPQRHRVEKFA